MDNEVKNTLSSAKQAFADLQEHDKLLKKKEVAERLRVTERSVDKYAEKGLIDKLKVPGSTSTRFFASQVNALFSKPKSEKGVIVTNAAGKVPQDVKKVKVPNINKAAKPIINTSTAFAQGENKKQVPAKELMRFRIKI